MSYEVYKLIHFLGIFVLLTALTAGCMHALRGGTRADNPYRKPLAAAHGIAMFLILLGGFGMLARLGIMQAGLPAWIYIKLAIWIVFGAALVLVQRSSGLARMGVIGLPLLAVLAAAVALYKPF